MGPSLSPPPGGGQGEQWEWVGWGLQVTQTLFSCQDALLCDELVSHTATEQMAKQSGSHKHFHTLVILFCLWQGLLFFPSREIQMLGGWD